jgi:flagellar hook-associated protein 1
MSISSAFSIAGSGLRATEARADIVAGNIANAKTAGYVRREAVQVSSAGGGEGRGVDLRMARQVDERLAGLSRGAGAEAGGASVTSEILRSYLLTLGDPGDEMSPAARMATFQAGLDLLANNPADQAIQGDVLSRADSLARSLNSASANLESSRVQAAQTFDRDIAAVNGLLADIADLNTQLNRASLGTEGGEGILDELNRKLDTLGTHLEFRVRPEADGTMTLHTAGGTELVRGDDAVRLTGDRQTGALFADGADITPRPDGGRGFSTGRLAGLSVMLSTTIPQMSLQLDELARGLVQGFEQADASLGAGAPGFFTDNQGAFDPARLEGLAGRLAVNDSLRPEKGGALWRLRDGAGAMTPGEAGDAAQVNAFIAVFDSAMPMAAAAGLGDAARLGDFAADLVGFQQNLRVSADSRADSAGIRFAAFEDGRGSVEGVNLDIELQKLMEIEQAYGANSQVLSSLNNMLDTLLSSV